MRGNSYSKISAVLGIPRRTYNDIVQRFGTRGDLRDRHSYGRPQFLDERGDREVVRVSDDPSNDTTATLGGEFQSQGLDLSDDTVRRSLQRQGLQACVKTKKPFLTKKIKRINIYGQRSACMQLGWIGIMSFFLMNQKTILLAQMGGNIDDEGVESTFWANMCNLLSNLEEEVLLFGDA
jgi:transposase